MTLINKSLIAALSFLFLMATSPITSAAENPFGMTDQSVDQAQLASNDGKCGSGKCGEGKCGDSMRKGAKDGKCGEGKCGEGKCGEGKSEKKGKCGEGKSEKKGKCGTGKCGG